MKIAVAYKDGEVFEHFGKCETFKVFNVEGDAVKDSELLTTGGVGHDAVAAFLKDEGVDVVICGNMGEGARSALDNMEIDIVTGASGDVNVAVASYLNGYLESEDANCGCGCGESCGDSCGDSCGGGCGSCGGGCGSCGTPTIIYEGENAGKVCAVHYRGTLNDGTVFDSSYDRGEPLQFVCGVGMMIKGFDMAVVNMKPGDKTSIHLMPEEAYGPVNPEAILDIEISKLPGSEDLNVGEQVYLTNGMGQQFPVKVVEKTDTNIKLDANHEMAGKELNFDIELVSVNEQ